LILPSVDFTQVIEIEPTYPKITLKALDRLIEEKGWDNVDVPLFKGTEDSSDKSENIKVKMRVVSPVVLNPIEKGSKAQFDELIIHIHGGGWVSGSSFSNQNLTREWAKKLGKPVFGLDYRLAPEHKYPSGLDDCWQAYNWLVDNAHSFDINPKKIVLVGDSAGGNLALGLALLLIKDKRRVPDGLVLPYPGLKLDEKCYTPSFLNAMDDPILAYSYLGMILGQYLDDPTRGARDPIASPFLMSDEHLRLLPPIRILVGSSDPLHDDSIRFVEKLHKVNCNVQLLSYLHLPHGFLSFGLPGGMPESKSCVDDCAQLIQDLLNLADVDARTI
jgi:hormone-sensitive lipase